LSNYTHATTHSPLLYTHTTHTHSIHTHAPHTTLYTHTHHTHTSTTTHLTHTHTLPTAHTHYTHHLCLHTLHTTTPLTHTHTHSDTLHTAHCTHTLATLPAHTPHAAHTHAPAPLALTCTTTHTSLPTTLPRTTPHTFHTFLLGHLHYTSWEAGWPLISLHHTAGAHHLACYHTHTTLSPHSRTHTPPGTPAHCALLPTPAFPWLPHLHLPRPHHTCLPAFLTTCPHHRLPLHYAHNLTRLVLQHACCHAVPPPVAPGFAMGHTAHARCLCHTHLPFRTHFLSALPHALLCLRWLLPAAPAPPVAPAPLTCLHYRCLTVPACLCLPRLTLYRYHRTCHRRWFAFLLLPAASAYHCHGTTTTTLHAACAHTAAPMPFHTHWTTHHHYTHTAVLPHHTRLHALHTPRPATRACTLPPASHTYHTHTACPELPRACPRFTAHHTAYLRFLPCLPLPTFHHPARTATHTAATHALSFTAHLPPHTRSHHTHCTLPPTHTATHLTPFLTPHTLLYILPAHTPATTPHVPPPASHHTFYPATLTPHTHTPLPHTLHFATTLPHLPAYTPPPPAPALPTLHFTHTTTTHTPAFCLCCLPVRALRTTLPVPHPHRCTPHLHPAHLALHLSHSCFTSCHAHLPRLRSRPHHCSTASLPLHTPLPTHAHTPLPHCLAASCLPAFTTAAPLTASPACYLNTVVHRCSAVWLCAAGTSLYFIPHTCCAYLARLSLRFCLTGRLRRARITGTVPQTSRYELPARYRFAAYRAHPRS